MTEDGKLKCIGRRRKKEKIHHQPMPSGSEYYAIHEKDKFHLRIHSEVKAL